MKYTYFENKHFVPNAELQTCCWNQLCTKQNYIMIIKLKECEKKDKYHDLARELKKLWNMKVTIVLIVTGAFGTITKG